MKKTNFDLYLEEHLKDPGFAGNRSRVLAPSVRQRPAGLVPADAEIGGWLQANPTQRPS